MSKKHRNAAPCSHRGEPVRVGPYEIYAGGTQYLTEEDSRGYDLIVPLTDRVIFGFGGRYQVLAGTLIDYGGVPDTWREFLDVVVGELKEGKHILTFCVGSHGRTGCFLGSLIALLESTEETPDPIEAIRNRHCRHAVETRAQAEAIFAIRGRKPPSHYDTKFSL